ncbi:MAG TPA: GAF domain-containing protein [Candidatus Rifleibacterium sp.]|nr:GAF domain-containing protein [Candidatus Rifleibacterium sp.]HPW58696.1 GAF domain-containing protein [Candidatus Rifleibacterium sp.]
MAEGLKVLHQQLLYEAQKQILSSGKNTDVILQILSRTSVDLFGKKGFGVLFYDASAQISRIRFNDGFSVKSLNFHCEEFTRSKLERRPFPAGPVADESGETHVLIPLGPDSDPFGVLLLQEMSSSEAGTLAAFRELATTSISTFLEVELVRLRMEEMGALLEVGRVVSSTLDLRELLTKIMSTATKVMRCETSTVYLVDEQTNELYFHIVSGDPNVGAKLQEIRLPMGTGLAGWCAQNNKPVIVPDTEKDPRFFKGADKKSGFVTRSMICVPMRLKDRVVGVLQVLNRTGDIPFNDHDLETLENVANQAVSAIENARLYENIQKVYLSTIEVLATAIDAKDPYTQGHSRRVTQYSVAIAEELNLSPKEVESIRYAGLLHDVGKIGIKDSIIRKPGRLTDEEYAIIKKHPAIGAKILRPVDFLADKIPGVLHHHEYYDGRGYPEHLTGENIPLAGRIICVADAFDAMTTNRPYRKGLTVKTAVGELQKFSGKQFDPVCVEAFMRAFDRKLFQYFVKVEDSDDMVLIDDESESRDPAEGIHGELDSQPYPPMAAHEMKDDKKLESQPYPPVIPPHAEIKTDDKTQAEKPSSQPYPPITGNEKPE